MVKWQLEVVTNGVVNRFIMKDQDAALTAKKVVESKMGRGQLFRNEASELFCITSEDGEASFVADHISSVRIVNSTMWEKIRREESARYAADLRTTDHEFIVKLLAAKTTDRAGG
jgi:3-dehydroquinate synthase class II